MLNRQVLWLRCLTRYRFESLACGWSLPVRVGTVGIKWTAGNGLEESNRYQPGRTLSAGPCEQVIVLVASNPNADDEYKDHDCRATED